MSITGKVAVVTGATAGVGRGIATEFARRGAKVVATGRREEEGTALEKEVRDGGGELTFVRADVTSEADTERVATAAVETYERLDVLVCNAGTVSSPAVVDTHEAGLDWWNEVISTNLTGTFLTCRAALPHMMSQHDGQILTISSINSQVPVSRMAAYNSSKAAVTHLTRTIALEYLIWGIRANTVILGGVVGGTNDAVNQDIFDLVNGGSATPERRAAAEQMNAMLNDSPERVGAALDRLCSDELANITGTEIRLDRGLSTGMLTDLGIYMTVGGHWSLGA